MISRQARFTLWQKNFSIFSKENEKQISCSLRELRDIQGINSNLITVTKEGMCRERKQESNVFVGKNEHLTLKRRNKEIETMTD